MEVDKNDLGGWKAHRKSALVHNEAVDEADALAQVRRFLSYLPRSVHELAPVLPCDDDPNRADDWLKDAIPHDRRKIYDPRRLLAAVFDRDSLFEIGRQGGSVITMFGRLMGVPVGVIANDPKVQGGAMTLQAGLQDGAAHPAVQPVRPAGGELRRPAGQRHRARGRTGRHAAGRHAPGRGAGACRSPWVSILIRRCFGMAAPCTAPRAATAEPPLRLAVGALGLHPHRGRRDGRAQGRDRGRAGPGEARRAGGAPGYMTSPFRTAEKFGVLDIIDPRETRRVLCDWIEGRLVRGALRPGRPHRSSVRAPPVGGARAGLASGPCPETPR